MFPGKIVRGECFSTGQLGKFPSSHDGCSSCFRCFQQGHFARDCREAVTTSRPTKQDRPFHNSLPSDRIEFDFEVTDRDSRSVSVDYNVDSIDQNSVVKVKRLHENIAFWQSTGTSHCLLNLLCEGYCLPFVDLGKNMFFKNNYSASCNSKFVSTEISKLILVRPTDLCLCNPLG